MLHQDPSIIQFDYLKAMLFVTAFIKPSSCLVLGLGIGSIASTLQSQYPKLLIDVVELRQAVLNVAQRYFDFKCSKYTRVFIGDAQSYLAALPEDRYDIVFSDIYNSEGMDSNQNQMIYLENCIALLNGHGWLVVNFWTDHRSPVLVDFLRKKFSQILACESKDGNWVIYASNSSNIISKKNIREHSRMLSESYGFSFGRVSKNILKIA